MVGECKYLLLPWRHHSHLVHVWAFKMALQVTVKFDIVFGEGRRMPDRVSGVPH